MPFKRDPKGGGTEKDGTQSKMYCSYCYVDGEFASPEIDTAEKMQAFVKNQMKLSNNVTASDECSIRLAYHLALADKSFDTFSV